MKRFQLEEGGHAISVQLVVRRDDGTVRYVCPSVPGFGAQVRTPVGAHLQFLDFQAGGMPDYDLIPAIGLILSNHADDVMRKVTFENLASSLGNGRLEPTNGDGLIDVIRCAMDAWAAKTHRHVAKMNLVRSDGVVSAEFTLKL